MKFNFWTGGKWLYVQYNPFKMVLYSLGEAPGTQHVK